jgi:hypothetical protein
LPPRRGGKEKKKKLFLLCVARGARGKKNFILVSPPAPPPTHQKMKRKRVEEIELDDARRDRAVYTWWKKLMAYAADVGFYMRENLAKIRGHPVPELTECRFWAGPGVRFGGADGNVYLFTSDNRIVYVQADGTLARYPCQDTSLWPWRLRDCPELPADVWRHICTFLGLRHILGTVFRLSKRFRDMLLVDGAAPWTLYRRQLEHIVPPRIIGESVRLFYAGAVQGIAKSKPFGAWTQEDCLLAACIIFPFGDYDVAHGRLSVPSAARFRVCAHVRCGRCIVTFGHRRRNRHLTAVIVRESGHEFFYVVKREHLAFHCNDLTRAPRTNFYHTLTGSSSFSEILEFTKAVALKNE